MKCSNCGRTDHEPGAKFCHKCGFPLMGNANTPHTGKERPKLKEVGKKTLTGIYGEHGYVDLGLPSGTLWATCNVGAANSEDFGGYFAWGEIEAKNDFNESTYKWYRWSDTRRCWELAKYCSDVDNKWKLDLKDDVAHVKWGGKWRIPTQEQFQELKAQCKSEWTTLNGVKGCRFTSKINGNSIFFPACGHFSWPDWGFGSYWSSYKYPDALDDDAIGFNFSKRRASAVKSLIHRIFSKSPAYAGKCSISRSLGCCVRPVMK